MCTIDVDSEDSTQKSSPNMNFFRVGQRLVGRKFSYRLLTKLKTSESVASTVWKAEIFDSGKYKRPATHAIVKTANWDRYPWLERERDAYRRPSIRNSPHIRRMYDEINDFQRAKDFEDKAAFKDAVEKQPYCLVLEFMSTTLKELDPEKYKNNLLFMAALFRGMIEGTQDIKKAGIKNNDAVWTDAKPENMLCSDVDGPSPVVKISDLGLAGPAGFKKQLLQPEAMRAPEVWAGRGCIHVSDVWSIGAAVLVWLKHNVLGPQDVKDGLQAFSDAWCIAKIIRTFETKDDKMPDVDEDAAKHVKSMYKLGRKLLTQPDDGTPESMHVTARPFDEVLRGLALLPQVEALLRRFFVLNSQRRPTAETLFSSQELESLHIVAQLGALNAPTNPPTQSEVASPMAGLSVF
ncbi:MAG: hypothetical protein Q9217_006810 [Psora testacea]